MKLPRNFLDRLGLSLSRKLRHLYKGRQPMKGAGIPLYPHVSPIAAFWPQSMAPAVQIKILDSIPRPKQQPVPTPTPTHVAWLDSNAFQWLPLISFMFMVYNSVNAIIQSRGDRGTIAFVFGSLTLLGGLFWSMREFEKITDKASPRKHWLKVTIWLLAMALNALFSYRVTAILDSTVMSVVVWGIAVFTGVTGCYFLFLHPDT